MLRNMIRRSGMLAIVLALALAGTAPAVALDFGVRNLDGWHTAWSWLTDVFGWGDEAAGNSGGFTPVYERLVEEGPGVDPNGAPTVNTLCPTCEEGPGVDPNGLH
ncbi:MAG TPA: hypothetical protein VNW71_25095 [Thermoanaerobaculia bacterium]|nr:hypothetical protein [Thermoanaerobaculia bacterium]